MNKVIINEKQIFSVENNTVNGEEFITDLIKTGERFYHLLHKNKKYTIEIILFDKTHNHCTERRT